MDVACRGMADEREEKAAHLPVSVGAVVGIVLVESSEHDGTDPRLEDTEATSGTRAASEPLGCSGSVSGFTQSVKSGSFAEAMGQRRSVIDAKSNSWEKAPGVEEVVHSAPALEEFFIGEEVEDGPGQYRVLLPVTVCEACDSTSAQIEELCEGTMICVRELFVEREVNRLRARIASPPGWISLADPVSGQRWAEKALEEAEPATALACRSSCEGSAGSDSPVRLAALSVFGSKVAVAASSLSASHTEPRHVDATFEEQDPFKEFDRAQMNCSPDRSARQERPLQKLSDFARSTSRSFLDWTAQAEVAKDTSLGNAPEKVQDWKQRATSSFDRAGEKLVDVGTGNMADRHVAHLMDALGW